MMSPPQQVLITCGASFDQNFVSPKLWQPWIAWKNFRKVHSGPESLDFLGHLHPWSLANTENPDAFGYVSVHAMEAIWRLIQGPGHVVHEQPQRGFQPRIFFGFLKGDPSVNVVNFLPLSLPFGDGRNFIVHLWRNLGGLSHALRQATAWPCARPHWMPGSKRVAHAAGETPPCHPAPVWNRFHPAVPFLKGSYPASTKISQFRCLPSETLV